MRVACIYFPISSVGGIATVAKNLKHAALAVGDTFDILRSSNAITLRPRLFDSPHRIRGGDTHIEIDGEAPHGTRYTDTQRFLKANYDALFFVHPCSHPTKEYGTHPDWTRIYDVKLPKVVHVADGYAATYPWFKNVLPSVNQVWVNQEAYAGPLTTLGIESRVLPHPFWPIADSEPRSASRLTLFPNQWKQIKCPFEFVAAMPKFKGAVELYSNGIEYYNIRKTALWREVIGVDRFAPDLAYFNSEGNGHKLKGPRDRVFFGNVPLAEIAKAYQRAWSIVDLMGQRAKFGAYRNGAFNYTALEALWFGARPILHEQARQARLPLESVVTIDLGPGHKNLKPLIEAVNGAEPMKPAEQKRVREWIHDRHHAAKLWTAIRKGLK